jgi:hypothetical protein
VMMHPHRYSTLKCHCGLPTQWRSLVQQLER